MISKVVAAEKAGVRRAMSADERAVRAGIPTAAKPRSNKSPESAGKAGLLGGMDGKYVVLDFETTGFSPSKGNKIIEIGAVEITGGSITGKYETLVNPETLIRREITEITSISNVMVRQAPTIESAMVRLMDFIGNATLAAHNIDFEMRFVLYECERLGLKPPKNTICTLKLARRLYPGLASYKLGDLLRKFGIVADGPLHRALPDAKATAEMLIKMRLSPSFDASPE